ncbi:MAG: hypothetical protein P8X43_09045 [Maritimibacter sp.]
MRKHLLVPLFLMLAPGAVWAAGESCEYRNPDHPNWDFHKNCNVVEQGALVKATVSNGSKFSITTGDVPTVNDLPARRIDQGASRCWKTLGAGELICIHPEGGAPEYSDSAPAASGAAADMADSPALDAGFGGGQNGFCRLESLASISGTSLEDGPCVKRDNCVAEGEGDASCLSEYAWKSGRITETAQTEEWITLDGGAAEIDEDGCYVDAGMGRRFCYSTQAPGTPPAPSE